jgi:hypothetical protein
MKYFDKTFFKFLGGFVTILVVSFFIIAVASYFENQSGDNQGNNQVLTQVNQ